MAAGRAVPAGGGQGRGELDIRRHGHAIRSIQSSAGHKLDAVPGVLQGPKGGQPRDLRARWGRHLRRDSVHQTAAGSEQGLSTRRDPTRAFCRHAAVRALSDLSEGVQAEVDAAAARLHPHRVAAVPLSGVRQAVSSAVASDATPAHPHEREALRLCLLRAQLPTADDPEPAPAHPHGGEAVQVSAVRQGLQAEGHPGPAHTHPPGRPTVLLSDAELQAKIRDRARGEEAHRQSHEPSRGEGASQLERRTQASGRAH